MKTRDTIILLVAVVAVGLFIYVYERTRPSTGEIRESKDRILPRLDREKVTKLTIEKGPARTVLERVGTTSDWKLKSPVETDADGATVDGLLSDLEFLSYERRVEKATGAQRKSFGLVEPTLELEVAQGKDLMKLVLGSDSEAGGVYLAIDGGDTVYVVDTMSIEGLRREPWEFRQKLLLGKDEVEVTRITSRSGAGPAVRLERKGDRWTVAAGDAAFERASDRAAGKVASSLAGLKALRFLGDGLSEIDLAGKGFGAETSRVEYEGGKAKGTILFGPACKEEEDAVLAFVLDGGTLVCVGRAARDSILAPPGDLRLTSPIEVEAFEVASVEARVGGEVRVRLEKDDEGAWFLTAPGARRSADSPSVEGLIEEMGKKKAPSLLPLPMDLAAAGLHPETAVEVVLLDYVGEAMETVLLGRDPSGSVTFQRKGEDRYGVLGPDPVLASAASPWAYLERKVLSRDYFEASRLSLSGPVSHVLVKKEGTWAFESPSGMEADAADVRDAVETFSTLTADRFLSDASPPSLESRGLARPAWTIEVTYEKAGDEEGAPAAAPVKPIRLLVGAQVEGGFAAYLEDQGIDAVMLLPSDVVHRLTRPLADKGSIAASAETATEIVLARKGSSETFSIASGRLEAHASGEVGLFDLEKARSLYEKLRVLRASRVVSYGPPPPEAKITAPTLVITLRSAAAQETVVTFGASFSADGEDLVHVRMTGVDATFGVEKSLIDILG